MSNYLDKKDFFQQLLISIKNEKASDKLCEMFYLLCDKYVNSPKFVRYCHIREDLISEAVLACFRGYNKFSPLREGKWDGDLELEYHHTVTNNPFAYFTTCAHNAILQFLKKEYNQVNIKNEMRIESGLGASYGYEEMMAEKNSVVQNDSDNEDSVDEMANGG